MKLRLCYCEIVKLKMKKMTKMSLHAAICKDAALAVPCAQGETPC